MPVASIEFLFESGALISRSACPTSAVGDAAPPCPPAQDQRGLERRAPDMGGEPWDVTPQTNSP